MIRNIAVPQVRTQSFSNDDHDIAENTVMKHVLYICIPNGVIGTAFLASVARAHPTVRCECMRASAIN